MQFKTLWLNPELQRLWHRLTPLAGRWESTFWGKERCFKGKTGNGSTKLPPEYHKEKGICLDKGQARKKEENEAQMQQEGRYQIQERMKL